MATVNHFTHEEASLLHTVADFLGGRLLPGKTNREFDLPDLEIFLPEQGLTIQGWIHGDDGVERSVRITDKTGGTE